jgi:putative ABC transport system permease protein
MNIARLSLSKILSNPVNTLVSIFLFAIGTGIISLVINGERNLQNQFSRNLAGIDLVVGAKGSPLQLILSSVFHLDTPTGNISLADAEKISRNPMVEKTIPLAMGDNYQGFRIVGTTPEYATLYQAGLSAGKWFVQSFDAVIGADVARKAGLRTGDHFTGRHGFTHHGHHHDEDIYTVTGIMEQTGTVMDALILTTVDTYWMIHAGHQGASEDEHNHRADGEEIEDEHRLSANQAAQQEHTPDAPGHVHDDSCRHDDGDAHDHDHVHTEDCDHSIIQAHPHTADDHVHPGAGQSGAEHGTSGLTPDQHKLSQGQFASEPGSQGYDQKGKPDDEEAAWEALIRKLDAREDLSTEEMDLYRSRSGQIMERTANPGTQITALLVFYSTPRAAIQLPRMINDNTPFLAASPAFETHRLFALAGSAITFLRWLAWIIMIISALNVFIHLTNTLHQNLHEVALIRALGAGRLNVLLLLVLQGLWVALAGGITGIAAGKLLLAWLPGITQLPGSTVLSLNSGDLLLLAYTAAAGIIAAVVPAIRAYRTDVHHILTRS